MTAPARSIRYGDGAVPVQDSAALVLETPTLPEPSARPARAGGGLDAPIAAPPLECAAAGAGSVLVAVSDGTRATGIAALLPDIVARLRAAGVRRIAFAVGSGLHRRPTAAEVDAILGSGLAGRHEVVLHDPDDRAALVDLGRTSAGTPVRVHRALVARAGRRPPDR